MLAFSCFKLWHICCFMLSMYALFGMKWWSVLKLSHFEEFFKVLIVVLQFVRRLPCCTAGSDREVVRENMMMIIEIWFGGRVQIQSQIGFCLIFPAHLTEVVAGVITFSHLILVWFCIRTCFWSWRFGRSNYYWWIAFLAVWAENWLEFRSKLE